MTLLDRLEAASLLDAEARERLAQAPADATLDRRLTGSGAVAEHELLGFLARELALPWRRELGAGQVPERFVERVPIAFARHHGVIAWEGAEGRRLLTCQPLDVHAIDELAARLDEALPLELAPRAAIEQAIDRAFADRSDLQLEALETGVSDVVLLEADDLLDATNKGPVVRTVNNLLLSALKRRASDIHLHPYEDRVLVRFRIDGVLYDIETLPKSSQDAITTRVKVLGKMDIAERRLPQDGRASRRVGSQDVDLRISSVPSSHGERIVFRILDRGARLFSLSEIGIEAEVRDRFRGFVNRPNGIVLVTGPTGSGKTTTLYAVLSELDTTEKNVLTIEDPIEYHLEGISQVQVSAKKGLTFASGLRSFLRQDPDVMMVGEIRDRETASIAIQAAQTGHLVFSTLHTNDSAGAVTRMLDIGVEPYLASSSLVAVMAQRLVRRICDACGETIAPEAADLAELGLSLEPGATLRRGAGCDACMGTGFRERTGIYELMAVSDAIRGLVIERAGASRIKRAALAEGMRSLRMDGAEKVRAGLTTIAEVLRVTFDDGVEGA